MRELCVAGVPGYLMTGAIAMSGGSEVRVPFKPWTQQASVHTAIAPVCRWTLVGKAFRTDNQILFPSARKRSP